MAWRRESHLEILIVSEKFLGHVELSKLKLIVEIIKRLQLSIPLGIEN